MAQILINGSEQTLINGGVYNQIVKEKDQKLVEFNYKVFH